MSTNCASVADVRVAALRAFEPLFLTKPKALKKWLKRIRNAAGPARDIDVMLERFHSEDAQDAVATYACKRLENERHEAQKNLVEVAAKASRGKLVESVEKCLRALAQNSELSDEIDCRKLGRITLRVATNAFLPLAVLPNPTISELHQLRIAGKRLRYSIEIFHSAFPSDLREDVYPAIESLQNRLGKINDHATAQKLFQSWLGSMEANALAADLAKRIVAEHKVAKRFKNRFSKWWTEKRVAKLESMMEKLLVDKGD